MKSLAFVQQSARSIHSLFKASGQRRGERNDDFARQSSIDRYTFGSVGIHLTKIIHKRKIVSAAKANRFDAPAEKQFSRQQFSSSRSNDLDPEQSHLDPRRRALIQHSRYLLINS